MEMTNTTVYLHSQVSDYMEKLSNKNHIIGYIAQLQSNPENFGDYREPDPRGRMIEVKILGRHALIFFKDPFAGIIKILDLRNVELL